jgi:probable HAF family extracellular repeat protein
MTDLGALPGDVFSLANSVNNRGQIVGFSQDASFNSTALLWQHGVMTDLNALIPPGSHFFLQEALGINNRGQIVGYGIEPGQVFPHGYLLTHATHPGVHAAASAGRRRPPRRSQNCERQAGRARLLPQLALGSPDGCSCDGPGQLLIRRSGHAACR